MKIKSIALSLLLILSGMSVSMQGLTYYDILGVDQDAKAETITKSYRDIARENHPDKKGSDAATKRMQSINEAYNVLKDADIRKKYDDYLKYPTGLPFDPSQSYYGAQQYGHPSNQDTHFTGHTHTQNKITLLAGILGAKATYSYLTRAWDEYTLYSNFAAIKKHAQVQLENVKKNKPIIPMHDALDIHWVTQLRRGGQISSLEQAINQFDRVAMQNPRLLSTVSPQVVKEVDRYCNVIGNGKTNLFKAAAIVGVGALGYLTSDKWLPQLSNSRFFRGALYFFTGIDLN